MKISINNFKSIGSLANYEMRPLTILSGTNSSGKSSYIQLLLLLKQTIEVESANRPLDLNGNLFKVRDYLDIISGKNKDNKLKVEFVFNKTELIEYKDFYEISFYEAFENYDLHIIIEFDLIDTKITVASFEVKFVTDNKGQQGNYIRFENIGVTFNIQTDVAVFNAPLYSRQGEYTIKKINYSSFIPSDFEIEYNDGRTSKEVPQFDGIKTIIKDFFANLNYIGPLRKEPKDEYSMNGSITSVGKEGENVAEVLYEWSERVISFFTVEEKEEVVSFIQKEDTFLGAVKFWLCDTFKLCSDIYSKKEAESYVIYVKSLGGIESTIKHVGFGISQVLPIIVEGLRLSIGKTLILEQPEIHLHPKAQSNLADFLIAMIAQEKKVIIETHSDHLITRLRRRIAEDSTNNLDNKVLLTFVEVGTNDILFRNIDIDDLGNLDYFPDDFIEKPDAELKAILKAQMKKRISNKDQ